MRCTLWLNTNFGPTPRSKFVQMPESGEVPSSTRRNRGINILGCPLGHEDFVSAQLQATTRKHQVLLQAIPTVPDIQSAWLLFLHCASARANYQLRVLGPDVVLSYARAHDAGVWQTRLVRKWRGCRHPFPWPWEGWV